MVLYFRRRLTYKTLIHRRSVLSKLYNPLSKTNNSLSTAIKVSHVLYKRVELIRFFSLIKIRVICVCVRNRY